MWHSNRAADGTRSCSIASMILVYAIGSSALAYAARLRLPAGSGDKKITFIRHGQSMGNLIKKKPVSYVREAGLSAPTAWKDGHLSEGGREVAMQLVMKEYDDDLVDRILSAEVVLVSPLVRTLETCIVVLATALKRRQLEPSTLGSKKFMVMSDLREKVSSESDKPGAGDSESEVLAYLREISSDLGIMHFGDSECLRQVAKKIGWAYLSEARRTKNFQDHPDDADKILSSIHRFRERLSGMDENRIVIFGHSAWARFTFAAGMQGTCLDHDHDVSNRNKDYHVAFGGRHVRDLENIGVLTAGFSDHQFHHIEVVNWLKKPVANCLKSGTNFAPFSSLTEAKDMDFLPTRVVMHRILVHKADRTTLGLHRRWLTFSAVDGRSFLAWASRMGRPKYFIDFSEGHQASRFRFACDEDNLAVLLSSADNELVAWSDETGKLEKVRPFLIKPHPESRNPRFDFQRVCLLLQVHIQYATDRQFKQHWSVASQLAQWENTWQREAHWERTWQRDPGMFSMPTTNASILEGLRRDIMPMTAMGMWNEAHGTL